jgi:hypothetical protein
MVWIYLDLLALGYQHGGMLTGLLLGKIRLGRLIINISPMSGKLAMTIDDVSDSYLELTEINKIV